MKLIFLGKEMLGIGFKGKINFESKRKISVCFMNKLFLFEEN